MGNDATPKSQIEELKKRQPRQAAGGGIKKANTERENKSNSIQAEG